MRATNGKCAASLKEKVVLYGSALRLGAADLKGDLQEQAAEVPQPRVREHEDAKTEHRRRQRADA